jgi:hypothetical protein
VFDTGVRERELELEREPWQEQAAVLVEALVEEMKRAQLLILIEELMKELALELVLKRDLERELKRELKSE